MKAQDFAETCELIVPTGDSDKQVVRLLSALDVEFRQMPLEEIFNGEAHGNHLILSEEDFISLFAASNSNKRRLADVLAGFASVLIYPFSGTRQSLEALADTARTKLGVSLPAQNTQYRIVDNREICGPFSGLKIQGVHSERDVALKIVEPKMPVTGIVTGSGGHLFAKFEIENLELFVISSSCIFDPSAMHSRNLDVRECFSGLVPFLFFLRHAKVNCPRNLFRWANWTIDCPNLARRYGFLNLFELQRSVRQLDVAATMTFIPWNFRRTSPEIVNLFKREWPRLSICLHGCDHAESEFSKATCDEAWLLVQLGLSRMTAMQEETSLPFERVMVFPEGRFSGEAMRALRASEMLAAVNTELVDCQTGEGVRGSELLRPAIMSFSGFPLFMRRPADASLADFALDLLLEKPCLVAANHRYYENGLKSMQSTLESLKTLQEDLVWTNLENGISSTCSEKRKSQTAREVRLYSAQTSLRVTSQENISFSKSESDAERVEVYAGSAPQRFAYTKGQLQFSIVTTRSEILNLEVRTSPPAMSKAQQSRPYRLKVSARRYLSEFRDNYLCRLPRLTSSVSVGRRLGRTA